MAYLARRIVLSVLTLWLLTLVSFFLLRIAPGDAVTAVAARSPGEGGVATADLEELRRDLGLDRSWPVQYIEWLGDLLQFDLGHSFATGRSVSEEIGPRVTVTLQLAIFAIAITILIGLVGGLTAARFSGSWPDAAIRSVAFTALSLPTFWMALVLIVVVASWTDHLLAAGYEPFSISPAANLGAVLPAAAVLAVRPGALVLRVARASTLEATGSQYFVLARAKGLTRQVAVAKHGFRSAMLPSLTAIGAQAALLVGGAVVIEQVFALPGLGRLLIESVQARDFPVVQALVLLFGAAALAINLVVDAAYVWLDPRVRLGG